jgi:glycosyltransferase involved in cell wall biosynthesis
VVDGTPLIGHRTGVGNYVHHLLRHLPALLRAEESVSVGAVTWRGREQLRTTVAGGPSGHRVPARLAQQMWLRGLPVPSAELVLGRGDVVHGTNFVLPPSRRAAGVVTVHDLAFVLHPETVATATGRLVRLVPRALERAERVLTPSHAAAADLMEVYGVPEDRVRVTPLGVDDAWFDVQPAGPALRARLDVPERYVVFVGTAEPRKNLGTLLAAHRSWRAEDPGAPALVLAGPAGWAGGEGAGRGVEDASVRRTGFLAEEDLRALVAGACALALPSRYEGFGLPVLEAMACGVPVVVSDIPVLREVAGGLGRTAPPGDADALADALRSAVDEDAPAARLRRVEHARERSWTRCASATLEAYREVSGR